MLKTPDPGRNLSPCGWMTLRSAARSEGIHPKSIRGYAPFPKRPRLFEQVRDAGIERSASRHTFRHSLPMHLLETHNEIRTFQALLGREDVNTTIIYTHIAGYSRGGVRSPLAL